ncbi:MAG TPA: hypothetical protein DGT23_35245 [Micromonosporaceae bacterium]|nr:hypothetical protein [Micromonosporaceae bacterium]
MFLRFKPDGANEDTLYEFRPDKTPVNRATIAEKLYSKATGERRTWEQLKSDALQGGIAARRVALWVAMTDQHPLLRIEDIPDFQAGALVMEYSKEELRRMRAGLADSDAMLDAEKGAVLAQLDRDIETAPVGSDEPDPEPEVEVEEPGKGTVAVEPQTEAWTS